MNEIEGTIIKTNMVVHKALLETFISELRSLCKTPMPLIGVDIITWALDGNRRSQTLILCFKDRCLIVRPDHLYEVPDSLKWLLADEGLCFVGVSLSNLPIKTYENWAVVELGHFVGRGLKRPMLEKRGIGELACEVGLNWKELKNPVIFLNRSRAVFTTEEIEDLIHYAYGYLIGTKLLSMI